MATDPKPNEIVLTRVYDAPVSVVWDAWTDPAQVAQWWGPRGFTITTHSKDLRVGGTWRHTMHGPDGVDYPGVTKYLEVERHSKLVYDHGGSEDRPPLFRVTVLFSEAGAGTRMHMTFALPSAEAARNTKAFIKKAGGDGTWDRLAEYLAKKDTGREVFVIARSFEAPIDKVFEMWTNPEHLAQWLPPAGFTMQFLRCDLRPGGNSFYVMSGAGGMKMYGRADYLEVRRPGHLVYAQQFCDENEKVTRHPMSATWPETMLTKVTLAAEGDSRTRVVITWEPRGAVTAPERETFARAKGGMTQGWTGSLDKLEVHLGQGS